MGLIIFSPFLILISVVIYLSSKGGVFYKQLRVGKGGKDFHLFKFRTMVPDAEKTGQITVGGRDPRVTGVGYFLRKYKLDELPQLFNIFLGEMSVVGPRPEVKKYVDMYTEEQRKVLQVKPGLTDYASIKYSNENEILGRSENPEKTYVEEIMPNKLELNLKYIEEVGLATDVKLIFQTIRKVFF